MEPLQSSGSVEGDDETLGAFLAFLDRQITACPDLLRPMTTADLEGVDELLVEVDLDEHIDPEFVLP
ncbi:hypothetical protein [Longimicrobium sp.]|uniref:hypothetical protein n=1 Tax=Longimicrobium sp. TaxID=2029185 RepID=UPI002C633812|nr:hypothetical protein [Longimicrobium sp.]HSU16958.1 hypothetical protein [Longimicrobium sp.]